MLRLALISILISQSAFAQDITPGEQEWINTLKTVVSKEAEPSLKPKVLLFKDPQVKQTSVLEVSYKEDICTFYLYARENSTDSLIQKLGATPEISRLAVAAHEYGHCVHRAKKLPQSLYRVGNEWPEALADAYAIVWVHTFYPEYYKDVVKFFWKLRKLDNTGLHAAGVKVALNASNVSLQGSFWEKTAYLLNNINE